MRLLVVGSDKVHAIENFFVKYIKELNVDTAIFPATSFFYDYYYKNIFNKVKFRMGLSTILKKINLEFKRIVVSLDPDIIWVFKGMELSPESLKWAKSRGIKLVNYNPDNPFIFTGRGSGNKNITNSLNLYDLHFTYSLEIEAQLKQAFNAKIVLLPFAFEIPEALYDATKDQQEKLKSCFLGNPDHQRVTFIKKLADSGVIMDIYGNDWSKFIKHTNITIFPPVYEQELWKVLARYRVQLNIMRVHNENSHNMRSFEVPAIGGILLAPDTAEHRIFFKEGEEIFLYTCSNECIEKINYLLRLSKDGADAIRLHARKRSLESGYSYKDRSRQVIAEMKLLNG